MLTAYFKNIIADGMCGKIAHFKINNGKEADMDYMLDMRDNLVHYVHLIDIYAHIINFLNFFIIKFYL